MTFDIEDAARKPGLILFVLVVLVGLGFGKSMFFTVAADEEAVIQRFGAYDRTVGPGLHFKLPALVETATKVPVKAVQTMEFGFATATAGKRTRYAETTREDEVMSRMLTGDLSLAHIEWTVLYRIHDAQAYLFNVGGEGRTQAANVRATIHDVAENVMRRNVGDISIDEAIMTGREKIGTDAKLAMQERLDSFGCGIKIVRVDVQQSQPPQKVMSAWDAVNEARQVKEQIINIAKGERNEVVPAARGEKKRAIREAEGYALRVVETATGRAEAFMLQAIEYDKAPDATRKRLYIEAMQDVLSRADVTIIDSDINGVLPFLDLNGNGNPITNRKGN